MQRTDMNMKPDNFIKTQNTLQGGFTLIEIMVAVIVLSIGLLGLAGLQVTSLRNDQSAFMRSQATILAYDIADRMRANGAAVLAGNYEFDSATDTPSAYSNCSTTTGCSVSEMAQNDLYAWNGAIDTVLPDGNGAVCRDSDPAAAGCDGAGSQYVITVSWTEVNDGSTSTFQTSFQP